ncbi:unnamed protein product [Prunus armeniaca]|uniref:Uncharacterized protein n=1 Tax=Prunus armeniaca TaxID=36596 RepID=A0A6J5W7H5_PRUAR|nr:unnamed protein product [Prunus armeniaca]
MKMNEGNIHLIRAKQRERRDRSGPSSPAAVKIDTATTAAVEINTETAAVNCAATAAAVEIDATASAADADAVFDAKIAVAEHAYRLALTGILSQHPVLANVGGRLIDLEVKAKIQVARRRAFTHGRGFIKSLYAAVDNGFVKLSKLEYRHDRLKMGRTDLLETIVRERNQEPEIKSLQEKVSVIEEKINQIDGKMDDFSDKLEGVIRSFEGENNDKLY